MSVFIPALMTFEGVLAQVLHPWWNVSVLPTRSTKRGSLLYFRFAGKQNQAGETPSY